MRRCLPRTIKANTLSCRLEHLDPLVAQPCQDVCTNTLITRIAAEAPKAFSHAPEALFYLLMLTIKQHASCRGHKTASRLPSADTHNTDNNKRYRRHTLGTVLCGHQSRDFMIRVLKILIILRYQILHKSLTNCLRIH